MIEKLIIIIERISGKINNWAWRKRRSYRPEKHYMRGGKSK